MSIIDEFYFFLLHLMKILFVAKVLFRDIILKSFVALLDQLAVKKSLLQPKKTVGNNVQLNQDLIIKICYLF